MEKMTVGKYLCQMLSQSGIKKVFGVAGDYNFTILDEMEKHPDITFIGNRNELNAGYSTDAYARINGIGAFVTTFGVGELSACNAVAGANSENVPIIHIVGAPPEKVQKQHKFMHHSLMDGDFKVFQKVYDSLTVYTANLTVDNAVSEIQKAFHLAMTKRKPVYIVIPDDLIAKEITVSETIFPPTPTSQQSLQQAIQHAQQILQKSTNTVLVSDVKAMRFGLQQAVTQLVDTMKLPVAVTVFGKGSFDETHPNYIGVYAGDCGEKTVQQAVDNAQCVIAVGLVWADTNTASFSAKMNLATTIQIQPNCVMIGEATYENIKAVDMLQALGSLKFTAATMPVAPTFPYSTGNYTGKDRLAATNYYPLFEQFIKDDDVIVVETGTLLDGFSQVHLPKNVTYITQGGWQSIGYATAATLGACIAAPARRVLLFTGDGSLQLTAQEISTMLENNCKPIIFILNNGEYIVEKYLNVNTVNQKYNIIPHWQYTKLPEAFGGTAYTITVKTVDELTKAMNEVEQQSNTTLCIIEMIPGEAMDAPNFLVQSRKILEAQSKNK